MAEAEVNKELVNKRPLYLPPLLKTLPPEKRTKKSQYSDTGFLFISV